MNFTHVRFFWVFLFFYGVHELLLATLDGLNYFHTKNLAVSSVPAADRIDATTFEKSKTYVLDKLKFGLFTRLVELPFFWFLIVLRGFNTFDYHAGRIAGYGTLTHSVLFAFFVGAYFAAVNLPLRFYSVFVVEARHGFNKTTARTFVADFVKGALVSFALGAPLLYLVFALMKLSGEFWWLWAWAAVTGFQIVVAAVFPAFLAPLFNKFTPLQDELLKRRIEELAQKIGFKMSGIYTIDGSRRSSHSNAYFAGMGRFRRIVLFDTILSQMTGDELVAVLAHEMGHNVKRHILKSTFLSAALSLAGFYVLSLIIGWPDFYRAFNVEIASPHAALIIFAAASDVFTFALTPIVNLWSRRNEYEADAFAVEATGSSTALKAALFKLTKENLSNPSPHPAYSFFHYSHPTFPERAAAIDSLARAESPR
jgi:STE24 endopeptidase